MSDRKVHKWARAFKDGQKTAHHESQSGRPSLVSEEFINVTDKNIREDQ